MQTQAVRINLDQGRTTHLWVEGMEIPKKRDWNGLAVAAMVIVLFVVLWLVV